MRALLAGNWTDTQLLLKGAVMNLTHHAVLHALFEMAKSDRHATVIRLGRAVDLPRDVVLSTLGELDRAGLVDAERVRLSMPGLVLAASIGAPRSLRTLPSTPPPSRRAA